MAKQPQWQIEQVDHYGRRGRCDRVRRRVVARVHTEQAAHAHVAWLSSRQTTVSWKTRKYVVIAPPDAAAARPEMDGGADEEPTERAQKEPCDGVAMASAETGATESQPSVRT